MRRYLVAGNWKMNSTLESARALAKALSSRFTQDETGFEVLVCPPYPYLVPVGEILRDSAVGLGAQNCYFEPPGAFTGEVAVPMLKDVGCRYVILGHSERRHVLGETDQLINKKVRAALEGELAVILCVGELLSERASGMTDRVLDTQMAGGLAGVVDAHLEHLVIAYEPVWAIGTGMTASTEQAQAAHAHLRKWLTDRYNAHVASRMRILYGGSVKGDNAEALLRQPDVDGALVGGASLKPETFLPIVEAAARLTRT